MRDNIPKEDLLRVLNGIEKASPMYGDARGVEGIYFVLLMLLVGFERDDEVRVAFSQAASRVAGHETNCDLATYITDARLIVKELRGIRDDLLNKK
jgi:hypothetical protein